MSSRRGSRLLSRFAAFPLGALMIGIGVLLHKWGAPIWVAFACGGVGVAMALDLLRAGYPARESTESTDALRSADGVENAAAPAVADEGPSRADSPSPGPPARPPVIVAPVHAAPAVSSQREPAPGAAAPPEAQRALGYARVSRASSAEELEVHGREIQRWCDEHWLSLVTIVHDVEAPGDAGATPALSWALERIAARDAQTLVVASLRHLASNLADLSPLLRWFTDPARRLVAIDLQVDTETEAGRLAAFALAGVGAWEHERLSARTRQGLEAARSRGAGRGRAAVEDLPELRDRIVRMRERGLTLQAIADTLNAEGVPTLRGGTEWRPSSVQRAAGYRRPATRRGVVLPEVGDPSEPPASDDAAPSDI